MEKSRSGLPVLGEPTARSAPRVEQARLTCRIGYRRTSWVARNVYGAFRVRLGSVLNEQRSLVAFARCATRRESASVCGVRTARRWIGIVGALVFLIVTVSAPGSAGDAAPASARVAFELALEAARAWSADATLVYLENDEALNAVGAAPRWGYLFYSPELEDARGYSIGDGKIVATADPAFRFDAPPLPDAWIDSDAALRLAQDHVREQGFDLPANMVLLRGAFDEEKPDRTCWLVCFRQEGAPATFVVVDSAEARVVRTWRG